MIGRPLVVYLLFIVLTFFGAVAQASAVEDLCPKTSKSREWAATCFEHTDSGRKIKKQFRKNLVLNRTGHAAIVITTPPELVSVNRQGKVVELKMAHLRGADFDFEPGDEKGDIVRFGYLRDRVNKSRAFKCGFYRTGKFAVLVPPVYDVCDALSEGSALVCFNCTSHCDSGDCHESDITGGEGLVINEKNEILKKIQLPSLPLCGHGSPKKTGAAECRQRSVSPIMAPEKPGDSLFNKKGN